MGNLLYNKSSVAEWETVLQSEIWEFSKERCDIVPALALSYIHLPSHLKVCFAYCALFPKDYEFKKEHLMPLWMTENLLHYPTEEVCQQYFDDLLSRSFFQQSGKKEETYVLNDFAKYVGGGIYFRWEVGQTEKIQKVTRHFSVELGYNQYFDGFGTSCNTERLHTFMPIGCLNISMSIYELFSKFKFLRILSFAGCSDIRKVPDSVSNLEHLRSLDHSLKRVPPHLGKLKNLKVVMNSFSVGRGTEFSIQRLGELNLDGSLSIGELQNIENSLDALEANLKNKTHLVKLNLEWNWWRNDNSTDSKKDEDVIENLQPFKILKELSIFEKLGDIKIKTGCRMFS
ncbi:hypothetical protein LR48_Vigan02g260200 [Vigna angularis]|uniref:NB-ARC domain-containing protein n=1 Tax=Phaseolus angularis TaxID=3914 RepID=A0A0L9U1C1_PHAAN|nr:hypothetical protein LR48_Vigan02g260200 [Vigna angularis]